MEVHRITDAVNKHRLPLGPLPPSLAHRTQSIRPAGPMRDEGIRVETEDQSCVYLEQSGRLEAPMTFDPALSLPRQPSWSNVSRL